MQRFFFPRRPARGNGCLKELNADEALNRQSLLFAGYHLNPCLHSQVKTTGVCVYLRFHE
jgi:hypothetical protein